MIRGGFRSVLGGWAVALALAGVGAGAGVAYVEARRLARDEALARVVAAAERARATVDEHRRALERTARLLAEAADDFESGASPAAAEVERLRRASELLAIRVDRADGVVAAGDPAAVRELASAAGPFAIAGGRLVLAASAESPARARVAISQELATAELAARPLVASLLSPAEVAADWQNPRFAVRREALERGESARLGRDGALAARVLVGAPAAGLVEVALADAEISAPLRRIALRSAGALAVVAFGAALVSLALATRLARPIDRLRAAAARLGRGDLEGAVAPEPGSEVDELARDLEEMRGRLARATGELERRRAELETVLAGVSEGVIAVDRDRRIQYLSPRAAALLGTTSAAAAGRFCGDLLRPLPVGGRLPCEVSCPIVQSRSRGAARAVERLRRADQEWNAVLASSPPAGGLQVLILHAESADDAARRARDAVVGDLAHELTTPLAAQSASLELLRERLFARDPEALELVLALEAGTIRLRRMIDNLLESVRIEAGQLAIRRQAFELDEVVEEAVALTHPLLVRRRQRLDLDLAHPLPTLEGDPQRLTQVLVNLIANASKFGPEESTVRLEVRRVGGAIDLAVEDEGPGLDPASASAPRRFVRGGIEPPEPGSGLGLWICRSILERHGGRLRVEPRATGARVVASLPAEAA